MAFIPARGGSKGIPLKNLKNLCGFPLIYWVTKAASEVEEIDAVYIATDDEQIKRVVESFKLNKVFAISRSASTATDEATTESALAEFAYNMEFDDVVLIQATSPLLAKSHLSGGIAKYYQSGADSLLSVVRQKRFIWSESRGWAEPKNYEPRLRPRRQEWDGFLVENGAFYICSRKGFLSNNSRLFGNIALFEMPSETYHEIDESSDWALIEQLKKGSFRDNNRIDFSKINLLICDVDGVLTDSGMYYSAFGDELKKFNTKDGKGIELLREKNIHVMFLTSEDIELVAKRGEKLKVEHIHMGVKNKRAFLTDFFAKNVEYSFAKSAYIGDDVNDKECLESCRFSAVPADGVQELKSIADYVCSKNGGDGCVREVCDLILSRI